MNPELVSVVVPCFNCEVFIERCVNSLFTQSHDEWELVLVDNNSNDGSFEILKKLEAERPDRIRVLVEPRQGASAARNTGLGHTRGPWVQFLDADDELLPEKFKEQLEQMTEDVCFVAGDYIYKTAKETIIARSRRDPYCGLISSNLGITSANLFNRRYLEAVGGWNEDLSSSQEYDLMFRLMQVNPRVALDRRLHAVVHRTAGSIMTRRDMQYERATNALNLRLRIREFLVRTGQFTVARSYFFSAFVGRLVSASDLQPEEQIKFNRTFYVAHRIATLPRRAWRRLGLMRHKDSGQLDKEKGLRCR